MHAGYRHTAWCQRIACVQVQKEAKWLSPEGPIMTSLETKASLTELLPCQVSVLVDSKLHNTRLLSTVDTSCYMHQRLRTQSCSYLVGVIFRVMLLNELQVCLEHLLTSSTLLQAMQCTLRRKL